MGDEKEERMRVSTPRAIEFCFPVQKSPAHTWIFFSILGRSEVNEWVSERGTEREKRKESERERERAREWVRGDRAADNGLSI